MLPKMEYPEKAIYNPDNEDFTITYDLNEDKIPLTYTIHAKEYGVFPEPVANHIVKHLADKIIRKREVQTNYEDEYNQVVREIKDEWFLK